MLPPCLELGRTFGESFSAVLLIVLRMLLGERKVFPLHVLSPKRFEILPDRDHLGCTNLPASQSGLGYCRLWRRRTQKSEAPL